MTPVEEMRAAATRVRDIASAANLGTWWADDTEIYSSEEPNWVGETLQLDNAELGKANAAHMVLWQPTLALLVASVLDEWARLGKLDPDLLHRVGGPETLALARAILGGAS